MVWYCRTVKVIAEMKRRVLVKAVILTVVIYARNVVGMAIMSVVKRGAMLQTFTNARSESRG